MIYLSSVTLLGGALVHILGFFFILLFRYLNFLVVALLLCCLFCPFQAPECLLRQTSASNVEQETPCCSSCARPHDRFGPTTLYLTPQTAEFKNNSSALKHSDFVQLAILELLSSGRVCRVSKCHLKVINPLSVFVQSCGKKALNFGLVVRRSSLNIGELG